MLVDKSLHRAKWWMLFDIMLVDESLDRINMKLEFEDNF